jgi:hypothetical protein
MRACPSCEIALVYSGRSEEEMERHLRRHNWQTGPWARIVIGLVLVQGLTWAFKIFWMGLLISQGDNEAKSFFNTGNGLILLYIVSAVGLLLSGALTGAGQHRGASSGGLLGLINGLAFVVLQPQTKELLPTWAVFSQPFVHMVFGTIGGWIGRRIWKPIPKLAALEMASPKVRGRSKDSLMRGPVHYVRITVGSVIAAIGILSAKAILESMIRNSNGLFKISSHDQAYLLSLEIGAFCMFLGGIIAGFGSTNGFKQGLFAGVMTAAIYMGATFMDEKNALELRIFASLGIVAIAILGGWFGAKTFPPLYSGPLRRRGHLD